MADGSASGEARVVVTPEQLETRIRRGESINGVWLQLPTMQIRWGDLPRNAEVTGKHPAEQILEDAEAELEQLRVIEASAMKSMENTMARGWGTNAFATAENHLKSIRGQIATIERNLPSLRNQAWAVTPEAQPAEKKAARADLEREKKELQELEVVLMQTLEVADEKGLRAAVGHTERQLACARARIAVIDDCLSSLCDQAHAEEETEEPIATPTSSPSEATQDTVSVEERMRSMQKLGEEAVVAGRTLIEALVRWKKNPTPANQTALVNAQYQNADLLRRFEKHRAESHQYARAIMEREDIPPEKVGEFLAMLYAPFSAHNEAEAAEPSETWDRAAYEAELARLRTMVEQQERKTEEVCAQARDSMQRMDATDRKMEETIRTMEQCAAHVARFEARDKDATPYGSGSSGMLVSNPDVHITQYEYFQPMVGGRGIGKVAQAYPVPPPQPVAPVAATHIDRSVEEREFARLMETEIQRKMEKWNEKALVVVRRPFAENYVTVKRGLYEAQAGHKTDIRGDMLLVTWCALLGAGVTPEARLKAFCDAFKCDWQISGIFATIKKAIGKCPEKLMNRLDVVVDGVVVVCEDHPSRVVVKLVVSGSGPRREGGIIGQPPATAATGSQ